MAQAALPSMATQGYAEVPFQHDGIEHPVFSKGSGRPVLVMHELPGLAQPCLNFAERLLAAGFQVHLPLLVGEPLQDAAVANHKRLCVSAEFACLQAGQSSPITEWLRALATDISKGRDGAKVGVIGMCLTGAFVIPLVLAPAVAAGVVSQPAIPFDMLYKLTGISRRSAWRSQLNIHDDELRDAATCARRENKHLLVQRYADDRLCPRERIARIAEAFGPAAEVHEYAEPSWLRRSFKPPHALLTEEYDRRPADDPATRLALQRVVAFLDRHL
jgi:dienelactone hydrolase